LKLQELLKVETELLRYCNRKFSTATAQDLLKIVEENVEGRCCHHRVIALNFIRDFFKEKLKTYLEIGVHNGTSMSYVLRCSSNPIFAIGVDLFEDTYGYYQEHDHINLKQSQANITRNNPYAYPFSLVKGNAWDQHIIDKVQDLLQGRLVDLLFIDGDHSYEGVQKDFSIYSALVVSGGIIVIDDYEPRYSGILKFVSEINLNEYNVLGVFQENELILKKK